MRRAAKSITFGGYFEYDKKSQRLLELNAELENPKVWDDANRARELGLKNV